MNNLKFEDLPAAMELALEKLTHIEQEIKDLKDNFEPKEPIELLTRKEASDFLKVDPSTLWHWSKNVVLPSYGIGSRVYYKRSDIERSLVRIN